MPYLLAAIRMFITLLSVVAAFIIVLFIFPIVPRRSWPYIIKDWSRITTSFMGVNVAVEGVKPQDYILNNHMVIANHISWLDILVLFHIHSICFVGRIEMKSWPILSQIITRAGTVYINRSNKRELIHINDQVSKKLVTGTTIGLFPEGKTSEGHQIMPFKAPLLQAAIIAKSTISPAVIFYQTKDGKRAKKVTYANVSLWTSVKNTLLLNGVTAKVIMLPPVEASQFESREELSNHLYQLMNSVYMQNVLESA